MEKPLKESPELFGEVIDVKDVVQHPQYYGHGDAEVIAKLNRMAPFLSMMRDKGMSYRQISEILEVLTGLTIRPDRVKKYIKKFNPPTIYITITDRMPNDGA